MECTAGTWDFDLATGLVKIGPTSATIGSLRFPEREVPLAELEGYLHGEDRDGLSAALRELLDDGREAGQRGAQRLLRAHRGFGLADTRLEDAGAVEGEGVHGGGVGVREGKGHLNTAVGVAGSAA